MSNELKLITADDVKQILGESGWANMADMANDLISKKLKHGYTSKVGTDTKHWDKDYLSAVTDIKNADDTHHIAYITWPIEEEVQKCINKHLNPYTHVSWDFPHCPDCGKKLS